MRRARFGRVDGRILARASTAPLLAIALQLLHAPAGRCEDTSAAPPVGLERLLKLPEDVQYEVERRGGATRTEWRTRFEEASLAVRLAQEGLSRAQRELEAASAGSSSWQLAPPGMPANTAGDFNYRLKLEVKRQREELERTTKRLQDLIVEANLAGVPASWRTASPPTAGPQGLDGQVPEAGVQ